MTEESGSATLTSDPVHPGWLVAKRVVTRSRPFPRDMGYGNHNFVIAELPV